jgi:hypothetical protein
LIGASFALAPTNTTDLPVKAKLNEAGPEQRGRRWDE